jgi:predicted amidohydrolase
MADGGEEPGIVTAQIEPERIAKARGMVPSLQHDRAFTPPQAARAPLAAE